MLLTEISNIASVDNLMSMNPLPPQAYTKDVLQKAYTWLLTQSPAIKEIASSQDMLIGLYLKAQRNGDASLETPSIQNFKQELKSLAGIMGDLQPSTKPQAAASTVSPQAQHHAQYQQHAAQPQNPTFNQTSNLAAAQHSMTSALDPASLQAIADVKQTLNLSSDTEALRALIALGHKQFKKI